jgi:hypothetical protein
MGNFQVYDALSILFELEKPLVEHLEGFILLSKKGGELQKKFQNSSPKFLIQELKRIPPLDQQNLVHRWWEECLQ